jgi:thiol-disulfide isomerase/thioredoxin
MKKNRPQIVNHFSHFCVLKKIKKYSMTRLLNALALLTILFSCSTMSSDDFDIRLKSGIWRGTLAIQGQELPFTFDVVSDTTGTQRIYIINASERLLLEDITFRNDSVFIPLHIFDASIQAKIENNKLSGSFIKHYDKGSDIPFEAEAGVAQRFVVPEDNIANANFTGKYSVKFFGKDTTDAVGIFHQTGDSVTGSFLTSTGDYRYLQGNVIGDSLHLSTFDGNHVYLFVAAKSQENKLSGIYYAGKTVKKIWEGIQNDNASLPDATSLTYLKPGYSRFDFAFPDADGNVVKFDSAYQNKVVVIQLMGTWCPNCMDETNFLVPWYEKNKQRGVEVIALAFERKDDFKYASDRVKKMITKLNVSYPVLIAGVNDKEKAASVLPMLTSFVAWPTTIYIGKDGKVKKIYTGFSGPGTGQEFEVFKQEFNETINSLLAEKVKFPILVSPKI